MRNEFAWRTEFHSKAKKIILWQKLAFLNQFFSSGIGSHELQLSFPTTAVLVATCKLLHHSFGEIQECRATP